MRLVRPTLVTVVATALVAAVLTAAPASARTDAPRDAQRGGPHFPATVKTTVGPGDYAAITTPTLPKRAETMEVKLVAGANATQPEVDAFDELTTTMGKMTKGKRLLTCILIYNASVTLEQDEDDHDAEIQFQANEALKALAVLVSCLRLAGLVTSTQPAKVSTAVPVPAAPVEARGKMRKCVQDKPGVPGTLDETDGGWTLTVDGTLQDRRNKLKIGCRTKSGKTVLRVRAAKTGVPLRKVVGKRAMVGIFNRFDAQADAPVKVTFSLP